MGNLSNKSSFEENDWKKVSSNDFKTILYNDITLQSVEKHEG